MSFHRKIILSQIVLFAVFLLLLFPFVNKVTNRLVRDSLIESTSELKDLLIYAKSEKEMIETLKTQSDYTFTRMALINDQGLVIFDTHLSRIHGEDFRPFHPTDHTEIQDALDTGTGYALAYSDTFRGKFAYVAERFTFQGKTFILRTMFPIEQIKDLTENFQIGILFFTVAILLFFNIFIWFIVHRFSSPIREIITAIKPYEETAKLPEIHLKRPTASGDDFQRLATVLNSLTKKLGEQIETLRAEKEEKEAILESLGEGVIAIDRDQKVLYLNFIAGKMLGVSRRNLIGYPLEASGEKVSHELLQRCKELLVHCQEQGTIMTDALSFGKEKKTYIDLIAAPKAHGSGAILVIQDKTSHYRILEMGKDFVANASHELRTPITIIKGYAETLHDMPEIKPELFTEITEKIGRNCVRMELLIHNLLTLADIENIPEARFKPHDLVPLVENSRHILRSVFPDAQVDIDCSTNELIIDADNGILELALQNLLNNAAKYSEPPAKIKIILRPISDEDVEILISDQGRGIPAEDLEHIFERFYRVDKTHSRKLGGAGLGLSIVKTIVEKHYGTITVTSELGRGTTFRLVLPIRHHGRL